MKFKLTKPRDDFGIPDRPDLNPVVGSTGIIKKESKMGYYVKFDGYPTRDYFLFKDEGEII